MKICEKRKAIKKLWAINMKNGLREIGITQQSSSYTQRIYGIQLKMAKKKLTNTYTQRQTTQTLSSTIRNKNGNGNRIHIASNNCMHCIILNGIRKTFIVFDALTFWFPFSTWKSSFELFLFVAVTAVVLGNILHNAVTKYGHGQNS